MFRLLTIAIALTSAQIAYTKPLCVTIDTIPEKTIPVPESKLRNMYLAAELGRNAQQKVDVLNKQVEILNERIDNLNKIIDTYKGKEGNYKEIIDNLNHEKQLMLDTRAILEKEIFDLNKQLVKSKKGKKWLAIGGVVSTVSAFIVGLIIKK